MIMINQPFHGQLGELLCEKLTQPLGRVAHFTIFSAFAKNSGVLRLKPALEQFKNSGGYITAFIGVDAHGTSYEAVLNMFELCDELYIVHSESPASTFHSKIYELTNDGNTWIAVGSNNLTGGGLWTNYESAVCFEDGRECEDCARKVAELSLQYKDPAYPCSRQITSRDDIDELLAEDYLRSEMRIQMETHRDTRRTAEQRTRRNLFGTQNGIHLPGIERVNQQHPAGTAVHNNQDRKRYGLFTKLQIQMHQNACGLKCESPLVVHAIFWICLNWARSLRGLRMVLGMKPVILSLCSVV